ncbi:MAG: hypothetical protein ABGW91_14645 [Christiangramia sp.]
MKISSPVNALLFLMIELTVALGYSQNKTEIRVFNAMNSSASVKFQADKASSKSLNIGSERVTDFQQLHPAKYQFRVHSNSKNLLQKELALAKNQAYTIIVFGRPELSSEVNQQIFRHKMHYIFEGSENFTANGFLPSYFVFREKVKLQKGAAAVRAFHAAAGTGEISITLNEPGKDQTKNVASKLKYASPVMSTRIEAGSKGVQVFLGNSPEPVIQQQYDFKEQKDYIFIITGKNGKLDLHILED